VRDLSENIAISTPVVFGTTDGGRTWVRENVPAGFSFTEESGYNDGYTSMDFIDAKNWVAATGTTFCATSDGGRTWKSVWPNGMPADLGMPAGGFVKLVFGDPNTGFGLFRPADGSGNLLYGTLDGGVTWELESWGQGAPYGTLDGGVTWELEAWGQGAP
jgi:photosystem II stability/assembly factor-like uncharacterized protein